MKCSAGRHLSWLDANFDSVAVHVLKLKKLVSTGIFLERPNADPTGGKVLASRFDLA
jgi:hypothetical protein